MTGGFSFFFLITRTTTKIIIPITTTMGIPMIIASNQLARSIPLKLTIIDIVVDDKKASRSST